METTATPASSSPDVLLDHDLYRVRLLPPEDWPARQDELLHYPQLPPTAHNLLVVVEEKLTGRIVASWFAGNKVMLEGIFVVPDARTSIAVPRLLLSGMVTLLQQLGIGAALTLAQDASILALARRAGFDTIDGTLLEVRLPPKE